MTPAEAGPSPDDLAPLLLVLAETTTLTLATIDPNGTPRATPLFFAADPRARLIFLSDPATPHASNLARDPRTAIGAYPEVDSWRLIRGVQMKGMVETLAGDAAGRSLGVYRSRFPFLDEVPASLATMRVYRFRPAWARLIDNRREFGFSREWDLE